ncbi:MAG: hypothetical protein LBM60_08790 [Clostridium sp.]|jgi:hypothetical protein|nr:hypothetical protein [Clostridium sp.]
MIKQCNFQKSRIRIIAILFATILWISSYSNQEIVTYMNVNGRTFTITTVNTPNNTPVEVWEYTDEINATELSQLDAYAEQNYPAASKVRNATGLYNCHSYAWYYQAIFNNKWMNEPTPYTTDGSYEFVASGGSSSIPLNVPNASKVLWGNDENGYPAHSGTVISSTTIRSKWGPGGLFDHAPGYSPFSDYDDILKYYDYAN